MKDRRRKTEVDWSKVPVIITGTPNPEALRLIAESIEEFEIQLAVQAAAAGEEEGGPLSSCPLRDPSVARTEAE